MSGAWHRDVYLYSRPGYPVLRSHHSTLLLPATTRAVRNYLLTSVLADPSPQRVLVAVLNIYFTFLFVVFIYTIGIVCTNILFVFSRIIILFLYFFTFYKTEISESVRQCNAIGSKRNSDEEIGNEKWAKKSTYSFPAFAYFSCFRPLCHSFQSIHSNFPILFSFFSDINSPNFANAVTTRLTIRPLPASNPLLQIIIFPPPILDNLTVNGIIRSKTSSSSVHFH